jgi:hypothetical protein
MIRPGLAGYQHFFIVMNVSRRKRMPVGLAYIPGIALSMLPVAVKLQFMWTLS